LGMYLEKVRDIEKVYQQSFSCLFPIMGKECGHCLPCQKKIEAFKHFGYEV